LEAEVYQKEQLFIRWGANKSWW